MLLFKRKHKWHNLIVVQFRKFFFLVKRNILRLIISHQKNQISKVDGLEKYI